MKNSPKDEKQDLVHSPYPKGRGLVDLMSPSSPDSPRGHRGLVDKDLSTFELNEKRRKLLFELKKRQNFRVAIGKSSWTLLVDFLPEYNLREILSDEVVIEFDMPKDYAGGIVDFRDEVSFPAINFTAINLLNAGYKFEIWEHGGKSPHIHIHNLPTKRLNKDELRKFKKIFIRNYVPREYLRYADESLTGIHLVALEWAEHWKGKYSTKKLLWSFDGM